MSDKRTAPGAWRTHPVQAVAEAGPLGLLLLAESLGVWEDEEVRYLVQISPLVSP
ncbi:MAG TPA: hypothetical protein VM537_34635 [Anaerolineae bacterium]|nr:hypothetical protein [Anaerolineae bacterium]